ncbi:hypothetical protein IQ07DRAFT_685009 [Pyrenochaeta sp. DS3sAY3a]|nr:hypothetical protein IQ07DRAFT_685009 [Pyrenochaeta sp. DS3sAY3a]
MAEIAGTAVGIVSLSIQICERLLWYTDNVKNGRDKAENLRDGVDRLTNVLELLETSLSRRDVSPYTTMAQTSIISCETALQSIKKLISTYSPAYEPGLRNGMERFAKRLVYPFKEADINHWKGTVNDILQTLQVTLHALELDEQRVQFDLINTNLGASQAIAHTIRNEQQDHFNQLNSQLISQTQMIMYTMDLFQRGGLLFPSSGIRRDPNATGFVMATSHDQQTDSGNTRSTFPPVNDSDSTYTRPLTNGLQSHPHHTRQRRPANIASRYRECSCRGREEKTNFLFWPIPLIRTVRHRHDEHCPRADTDPVITNWFLGIPMGSAFSRQKRGISIELSHTLVCYRVVSIDAPAFALINETTRPHYILNKDQWEVFIGRITDLIRNGAVSKRDHLPNGRNLLHYLFAKLQLRYLEAFHIKTLFLLIELFGNEVQEKDEDGCTCVDYLIENVRTCYPTISTYTFEDAIAVKLLEQGSQFTLEFHLKAYNDFFLFWSRHNYHDFSEPFSDCTDGVEMVLLQSEKGLRRIINRDRAGDYLISESNLALYQLATSRSWIAGCEILLQSGLKIAINPVRDSEIQDDLLEWARRGGEPKVLQFWLEQREIRDEDELEQIGNPIECFEMHLMFDVRTSLAPTILAYIVKDRVTLRQLAEQHLIDHPCLKNNGKLLDAHAICVFDELVKQRVDVCPSLKPLRKSIHYWNPPLTYPSSMILEIVFEAGFTDISANDWACPQNASIPPLLYLATGNTEFGYLGFIEVIQWYISKGANIHDPWPGCNVTALHCLGWLLGYSMRYSSHINVIPAEVSRFFADESTDGCDCKCSGSGCAFMHNFWKGIQDIGEASMSDDRFRWDSWEGESLVSMLWLVENATQASDKRWTITELLRLLIFSALEIRHTCCDIERILHSGEPNPRVCPVPRYPPKQTQRIQEEDAYLTDLLEELVPKFDARYDEFDGSIREFVYDALFPGLIEILQQVEIEDEALFKVGRRKLGVTMEPQFGRISEEDEEELALVEEVDESTDSEDD